VIASYGDSTENRQYTLDDMILSTSGSVVLEPDAIGYLRDRMLLIYLDLSDTEVSRRARERGVSRIVGMNGDIPRFDSVEAVLKYRR
jgi:shikimate kinase